MLIYSNTRRTVWLSWLVAIFWNALVWAAVVKGYDRLLQIFEEQPVFIFFALFPLVGVFVVWSAIRATLVWRKFGRVALVPAGNGNGVAGYVLMPDTIGKPSPARLSLICFRRYSSQSSEGTETKQDAIWQDEATITPKLSGSGQRLDFRFHPPSNVPASGEQGQDRYYWELRFFMPLPGIDCDLVFELPVVASMLGGVENPNYAARIAPQEQAGSTMPAIEAMAGGLRFFYPAGRSKGTAAVLMLIALFIGGFAFLMCKSLQHFLMVTVWLMLGATSMLVLMLFLLGLYLAFNTLTVEVGADGVRKEMRIFGYRLAEQVAAADIADIEVRSNGSSSFGNHSTVYYVLNLICRNRPSMEVGDSIENYGSAQRLRARMLTALGENRPSSPADATPPNSSRRPRLPNWFKWLVPFGKLLKYAIVMAALYDIGQWLPAFGSSIAIIKSAHFLPFQAGGVYRRQ